MNPSILKVPEIYKDIYAKHWNTIKTSVKKGVFKDVYHFLILKYNSHDITKHLETIKAATTGDFKINAAFGFIIKSRSDGELRFFHPSNNNTLFETPKLIKDMDDFIRLSDDLERQDALEYARLQRPSTSWTVERIICVRFDVYKLSI